MSQLIITVLSNNPAGGRCTLYTNYAQTLATSLGFNIQTIYPDKDDKLSAPGLLINNKPVMPNDGLIIDADDICNAIELSELDVVDLSEVRKKLELLVDEMMSGV